ncbi:hypothetical protein [Brevibacillus laterosporus]|uniref:hypothetical protein n=1 Tax=Brevibacillus laterosporus TaxID=1465 RepID=UPI001F549ED7|nr:hypothetical protein [Brevibacillus laterosporus]
MKEVNSNTIHPSIRKLLSFATSDFKVEQEYGKYLKLLNRKLYSFELEGEIVGCIGIEITSIRGSARVAPAKREKTTLTIVLH